MNLSTEQRQDLPEFPTPKTSLATWDNLPNEILNTIVGELDIFSRICLRQCDFRSRNIVQNTLKHPVEIKLKHVKDGGIVIHIRSAKQNRQLLFYCVIVEQLENNHCSLTKIRDIPSSPPAWQYDRKMLEKSYSTTAFDVLGQLLVEPLFDVVLLELELNNFEGSVHLPQNVLSIGKLRLVNCFERNPISTLLRNVNLRFASFEKMFGTGSMLARFYGRIHIDVAMRARKNVLKTIEVTERSYKSEFPEGYRVESYEDGSDRLRRFAKSAFTELKTIGIDKLKLEKEEIIDLMFLQAAYGRDPMSHLESSCGNYKEKIDFLRLGVRNNSLKDSSLSVICLVSIARTIRVYVNPANNTLLNLLKSDHNLDDYWTFSSKIDLLREIRNIKINALLSLRQKFPEIRT